MLRHLLLRLTLGAALSLPIISISSLSQAAEGNPDYSRAERLLFMEEHLRNVKPPSTLRYAFRKSGSLEEGFQDKVSVLLSAQPDGSCCIGKGEFLSDARRLMLPDIEGARANPVVLYFLENDVRNMHRLTKGQENHFRKRIRMAVYKDASVRDVMVKYRGQSVAGHEIIISPYVDDPNRHRFEQYARKQYVFILSEAVPGGVYGIWTRMSAADAFEPPLIVEEMFIDGAEPSTEAPAAAPSKESR